MAVVVVDRFEVVDVADDHAARHVALQMRVDEQMVRPIELGPIGHFGQRVLGGPFVQGWQCSSSEASPEASCKSIAAPWVMPSGPTTGTVCASTATGRLLRLATSSRRSDCTPVLQCIGDGAAATGPAADALVAHADQRRRPGALEHAGGRLSGQPFGGAVPLHDLHVAVRRRSRRRTCCPAASAETFSAELAVRAVAPAGATVPRQKWFACAASSVLQPVADHLLMQLHRELAALRTT